jgi:hypothetical protein
LTIYHTGEHVNTWVNHKPDQLAVTDTESFTGRQIFLSDDRRISGTLSGI